MRQEYAIKLWALLLVLLASSLQAEDWTFFSGHILKVSCTVEMINFGVYGEEHGQDNKQGQDKWEATATAEKDDPDPLLRKWSFSLGRFEPDLKGRHKAEKACSQWVDKANKHMQANRLSRK